MRTELQSWPCQSLLSSRNIGTPSGSFPSRVEFHQYYGIVVTKSKSWPGEIRPDSKCCDELSKSSSFIPEAVANALFPVSTLTRLD